jgi:hypothetical protein
MDGLLSYRNIIAYFLPFRYTHMFLIRYLASIVLFLVPTERQI